MLHRVSLNRATAVALMDGPGAVLVLIDGLAAGGDLDNYHLLRAARAELLRRMYWITGDSRRLAGVGCDAGLCWGTADLGARLSSWFDLVGQRDCGLHVHFAGKTTQGQQA